MPLLSRWFRNAAPASGPIVLDVGLVGREHAGKSVLLDQLAGRILEQSLPSGLQLTIDDPRDLAQRLRRRQAGERRLRHDGYTSTVDAALASFSLNEGGRTRVVLQVREVQGQLLTHTAPHGPAAQQDRYEDYLDRLAEADVLWQFLPCPPASAASEEVELFRDDVRLTGGFVRAALRRRQAAHPSALALLLNRIDARYVTEQDARKRMPTELLRWLAGRARQLAKMPGIGEACVIPVTALGFGSTAVRGGPRRADGLSCGEREWVLRLGAMPRPFGLKTLLVWSAMAGLRQQPLAGLAKDAVPELVRLCRLLESDLAALGGWRVPLPGV